MGFYFIFCEKKFLLSRENDDFIILLKKKSFLFLFNKKTIQFIYKKQVLPFYLKRFCNLIEKKSDNLLPTNF